MTWAFLFRRLSRPELQEVKGFGPELQGLNPKP